MRLRPLSTLSALLFGGITGLLGIVSGAHATTRIDLDGIEGTYPFNPQTGIYGDKIAVVHVDPIPDITGARFEVSGQYDPGEWTCNSDKIKPAPTSIHLSATNPQGTVGGMTDFFLYREGPFEWDVGVYYHEAELLTLLRSGGDLSIHAFTYLGVQCDFPQYMTTSEAHLDDVALVVSTAVGTDESTWGRLKGLYR